MNSFLVSSRDMPSAGGLTAAASGSEETADVSDSLSVVKSSNRDIAAMRRGSWHQKQSWGFRSQ